MQWKVRAVVVMGMMAISLLAGLACSAQPMPAWQKRYRTPSAGLTGRDVKRLTRHRFAVAGYFSEPRSQPLRGNVALLLFVSNTGDSLGVRSYRSLMLSRQPNGTIDRLASRPDGSFLAVGNLSDSLARFTSVVFVGDSLGNDRGWRYFDVGYGTGGKRLLALPDGYLLLADIYTRPAVYPFDQPLVPLIIKLDLNGNEVWRVRYHNPNHIIQDIVPQLDGSYALVGYQHLSATRTDPWIGAITATGDTLPGRRYPGLRGTERVRPQTAALIPNGGLAVAGTTQAQSGGAKPESIAFTLNAQGNVVRQAYVGTPIGSMGNGGSGLLQVRALANGDLLACGNYSPVRNRLPQTQLVGFIGPALQPSWQQLYNFSESYAMYLDDNGDLNLLGLTGIPNPQFGVNDIATHLLRLTGAGTPYQPPYCQTPPDAHFVYGLNPAGDELNVLQVATPGPRYAVLSLWHWDFGDGTTLDGPAPPPHRYAAPLPPGTPITLTVTNNLGCTHTFAAYPFALSTAAQRELAARLELYPNPARSREARTLRWPGLRPGQEPIRSEVLNSLGQVVHRQRLPVVSLAQGIVLNFPAFSAGFYTLRLQSQEGTATHRLVIQ